MNTGIRNKHEMRLKYKNAIKSRWLSVNFGIVHVSFVYLHNFEQQREIESGGKKE